MTRLCFLDTETTGLDPDLHEIWEVACIVRELPDVEGKADGRDEGEYVWQLPVDLSRADPFALNIGRFHERRWKPCSAQSLEAGVARRGRWEEILKLTQPEPGCETASKYEPRIVPDVDSWAADFARLTWGAILVGAVVSFDEERLRRLLRRHGACPGWHYHVCDVENLAVGFLAGRYQDPDWPAPSDDPDQILAPPWDSHVLTDALGIDGDRFEKHTALGDARWAQAIYNKILG